LVGIITYTSGIYQRGISIYMVLGREGDVPPQADNFVSVVIIDAG
jgi:hypothetical protein